MKVIPEGDKSVSYGGRFTGTVELEMLHATPTDEEPDTALVHFKDGAVTFWHQHPGGQQLFVVSGQARVGTVADGEVQLAPGALVTSPDRRHARARTLGTRMVPRVSYMLWSCPAL